MLGLYLIAAHLVGDFVFQTRWQAAGKFDNPALRSRHVTAYCVPFVPVSAWYGHWLAMPFLVVLWWCHYLTDSRRFDSTLGDVIAWPRVQRGERLLSQRRALGLYTSQPVPEERKKWLPPNPWSPAPLMVDQSLHVVQLAVLGGLFLS